MKKLIPLIAAYLMFNVQSSAQKNVVLTVKHMLGSEAFSFNQNASNDIGQTFVISRVDYYMSQFTLIHDGTLRRGALSLQFITWVVLIILALPAGRRKREISEMELS
jgi:hypothetical protein